MFLKSGEAHYNCTILDLFDRSTAASITDRSITSDLVIRPIQKALNSQQVKASLVTILLDHYTLLFEEWDWEQYVAVQKEESRAEGEANMLSRLVHTMAKTVNSEEIARAIELPLAQVMAILSPAAD